MSKNFDLSKMNEMRKNTILDVLGIELTKVHPDVIEGTMPVDHRTHQVFGLLHGGASVVLAETLGSIGAQINAPDGFQCVGLEINANHIRAVKTGKVFGQAVPLHKGRSTQVWEIKITTDDQKLVCVSRITMAVVPAKSSD